MQLKRFFAVIPALALSAALVAAQEPQPQPTQNQTQTSVGQPTDTNEPVYKGCVSGTKDNFTLTTSDGKSFRLHSDKDISEHVGKMVELRGTMKKEGADRPADAAPASAMQEIDVADLKNVEGSCPANDSSAMPQSDAAKTNEQASATEPAKTEQNATDSAAAQPATTEPAASEPEAAAAASNENQPATESQPSAAASSTESQPAASANAEVKTETPADASAEVKTETPAADASANAAVSTDQPAASASADVSANQATDQNATASTGNEQKTESDAAQLPQTASPLPLLGLLGFASTGLGWFLRRK